MDWRDKSACLTADPELFFPVGNTGPAVDQIEKAKAVCARCTVTETCLQYALETGQDYGVWGGLSRGRAPRPQASRRPRPPRLLASPTSGLRTSALIPRSARAHDPVSTARRPAP